MGEPKVLGELLLPLKVIMYLAVISISSLLVRRPTTMNYIINTGCVVFKSVMVTITMITLSIWVTDEMPNKKRMVKDVPQMEFMSPDWWKAFPLSILAILLYCV